MEELQIILPEKSDDALSDGLRELTRAIQKVTGNSGFGLGGEDGYGENFETPIFAMRRFYWGECDCGEEERSDAWHKANPHTGDCFRMELHRRFAKYDEESEYNLIDKAAHPEGDFPFSGMNVSEKTYNGMTFTTMTPREDEAMDMWRSAYEKRTKAHENLTRELYLERGLEPSPYQWLCTCGVGEKSIEACKAGQLGHLWTCSHELPNFLYKPTGFEVSWYKWIGRDNNKGDYSIDAGK